MEGQVVLKSFYSKLNSDKINKNMRDKNTRFWHQAEDAMYHGGKSFVDSNIIQRWMSGRPGLRRQTGAGVRSWQVETKHDRDDITLRIRNGKEAYYLYYHWKGGRFPKRLPVLKEWRKRGLQKINVKLLRLFERISR
jgi:hypothetical protein